MRILVSATNSRLCGRIQLRNGQEEGTESWHVMLHKPQLLCCGWPGHHVFCGRTPDGWGRAWGVSSAMSAGTVPPASAPLPPQCSLWGQLHTQSPHQTPAAQAKSTSNTSCKVHIKHQLQSPHQTPAAQTKSTSNTSCKGKVHIKHQLQSPHQTPAAKSTSNTSCTHKVHIKHQLHRQSPHQTPAAQAKSTSNTSCKVHIKHQLHRQSPHKTPAAQAKSTSNTSCTGKVHIKHQLHRQSLHQTPAAQAKSTSNTSCKGKVYIKHQLHRQSLHQCVQHIQDLRTTMLLFLQRSRSGIHDSFTMPTKHHLQPFHTVTNCSHSVHCHKLSSIDSEVKRKSQISSIGEVGGERVAAKLLQKNNLISVGSFLRPSSI